MTINIAHGVTVKLIRADAHDDYVVQAAQVSVKGENNPNTVPSRLIEALMKGKHGSPFEHNSFTFFVKAPIFVFREWMRHRIGGFNEFSARYSEMEPLFYIPTADRKMQNLGTQMKPKMELASPQVYVGVASDMVEVSELAWMKYQKMLNAGVAREVARMILPVNIYSQMYWTVNARSLMNFLSLRVESEASLVKSYPQLEIQMGAEQVEKAFIEKMPITAGLFNMLGRVAP